MTTPDDDAELRKDRELIAAASPEPWVRRHYPDCFPLIKMPTDEIQDITRCEDADFIVRARTRFPVLVAEIDRLRAELAETKAENERMREAMRIAFLAMKQHGITDADGGIWVQYALR